MTGMAIRQTYPVDTSSRKCGPSAAEFRCAVDVMQRIRATGGPVTEDEKTDWTNCQNIISMYRSPQRDS